jgi:dihydroorotate dehydrogenase
LVLESFYRSLIRPVLFAHDAEEAHRRTMRALSWVGHHGLASDALASFFGAQPLPTEVFGLKFPNPVGLAAGMDKYAEALPVWPALGFGFTELGAVTWHAQPGNPSPRLFRAVSQEAIINRMGFNNPGAEVFAHRLADWRNLGLWPRHPVGINLGKSKITPLYQAPEDYANSFRVLWPHLDFFVVNVSSPNTPNLRQLQDKSALDEILAALQEVQKQSSDAECQNSKSSDGRSASTISPSYSRITHQASPPSLSKPILVKVAPDLSFEALDEILELTGSRQISGVVATNTTITRPQTNDPDLQRIYMEPGGLSGRPLQARSTEVIRHLYRQTRGSLPIIGVGGIFSAADAWEKLIAGASLVQIYTGLIYKGPGIVRSVVSGLAKRLEQAGLKNLCETVGTASR